MVRQHKMGRICILGLGVFLVAAVSSAMAQSTTYAGQGLTNRRIASSILRRKAASGATVRTDSYRLAQEPAQPSVSTQPLTDAPPAPAQPLPSAGDPIPTPLLDPAPAQGSGVSDVIPTPTESYPVMPESVMSYAPEYASSPAIESGCGINCGGCDSCSVATTCDAGPYGCNGACGGQCVRCVDSMAIGLGVHGFKNGLNRGESGSFGFQESVNWGTPVTIFGMNTQIGFRATQSDFNGAGFTTESRDQFFVTAGLFKRCYHGWQGGFVFDFMREDWYTEADLAQVRGELSYAVPNGSSVGVLFASAVNEEESTSVVDGQTLTETWTTHDTFAFFYKVQSNRHRRGQWRVFAGFTGESDGFVGSDFKIPLAGTWSLEPEFTYVVPDEPTGRGGIDNEAWNVALNLVWYPGRARGDLNLAGMPMLDVAGNGSMITRRK